MMMRIPEISDRRNPHVALAGDTLVQVLVRTLVVLASGLLAEVQASAQLFHMLVVVLLHSIGGIE